MFTKNYFNKVALILLVFFFSFSQTRAINTTLFTKNVIFPKIHLYTHILKKDTHFTDNLFRDSVDIKIIKLSAKGIKLNKLGKLTETSRASIANRIRVCAQFATNENSKKGYRRFYVQIINPNGKLLGKNNPFKIGDKNQKYSDNTQFYYQNKALNICVLSPIKSKKDLTKGIYKIKVFLEGILIKKIELILK